MTTLHIFPSLTSSRPGLYDYWAEEESRGVSGFAASGRRILSVLHDIKHGRWWSLDPHIKIIRHNKENGKG